MYPAGVVAIINASALCSDGKQLPFTSLNRQIRHCTGDTLLKCFIYLQPYQCLVDYEQDWSFSLNGNDGCLLAANKLLPQPCCKLELNPYSFHLWGQGMGGMPGCEERWEGGGGGGGGQVWEVLRRQRAEWDKKKRTSVFVFQCAESKLQLKAIYIPVKNVPTI